MSGSISSNKRIAKNTMLLYMRMIFMSFIGLFTTRVILNALGVSDLGLMNVAGSVIGMFTFLNGTLTSGTQRFITYGIGKGNIEKLKNVFSCAMTLHLSLAVIIILLGETVGLWYVNNKLVIEQGRFNAAMWCYQLSILSSFMYLIQVPFNSALIAHEHMSMYAYMSIYDALAKLLAAYLIMVVPFDRVIFYSILSFFITIFPIFFYNWYCRRHFKECRFKLGTDKTIFREMLSFSGWNTIGCLAHMGQTTGVNLILNAFFGTIVNGARGIAMQANNWIYKFVESFLMAVRPQITKSYANGNYKRLADLVCSGSCFGCYLYLFLGIPLFIEIEWILNIWLGKCPSYTVMFLRIMMIEMLFQTMGNLTITAMHATGKMKAVNLSVAIILLCIVPLSYIMCRLGYSPEIVVIANVIPWIIVPHMRIYWIKKYCNGHFPIARYTKQVLIKVNFLAIIMFIPPFIIYSITSEKNSFFQFICVCITSVITCSFMIYYWGLDQKMRVKILEKTKGFIKRR